MILTTKQRVEFDRLLFGDFSTADKLNFLFQQPYDLIERIVPTLPVKTRSWFHQLVVWVWALCTGTTRLALFSDIGTGKSLMALHLMSLWRTRRLLVCCPSNVVRVWANDQIPTHTDKTFCALTGSAKEIQEQLLNLKHDIYIISYEMMIRVFGLQVAKALLNKLNTDPDDKSTTFIANTPMIEKLSDYFDSIIFDECHHLRAHNGVQNRIAHHLSRVMRNSLIMTGSPTSKDVRDLWGQYWVLNGGASLGPNFYQFRNRYFVKSWFDWKEKPNAAQEVLHRISPVSVYVPKESCNDLPECVEEIRYTQLSAFQQDVHDRLKHRISIMVRNHVVDASNVMNTSNRLSEVTAGFVYDDDGTPIFFDPNAKLKLLTDVLRDVLSNHHKVVVFHRFVEEARLITTAVSGIVGKRGFAQLRGEIRDKDRESERFMHNSTCRVMVAHPDCGGEGQNWQVASCIIFFTSPYGAVARRQCIGRVHRAGQSRSTLIIDLVCEKTIDEHTVDVVKRRVDSAESLLNWLSA